MIFEEFAKIPRLTREVTITEKIDGTNSCIGITETGEFFIGSRSRWITVENDNFGFARWAMEHKEELMTLGPGRHHGEWWGLGIQRGYGQARKRFSLFNTSKWSIDRPACCDVVPVLYSGMFDTHVIDMALDSLRLSGSIAAPHFTKPEGVIIYHHAANFYFKKTIVKDAEWKSATTTVTG